MKPFMTALLLAGLIAVPCPAHFVWIVPDGPTGTNAKVVFSDTLEPDDAVAIDNIAATKLLARDAAGKETPVAWKKAEHAFVLSLADKSPLAIGGVCQYGVIQRGEGKPFLLAYYPKWICGDLKPAKAWDKLAFEIVPQEAGRFQVLFAGKPAPDAEVVILPPSEKKQTLNAGPQGDFKLDVSAPGLYGVRAKHIEAKAGEHTGKKYQEVRHYATLVFQITDKKPEKAGPSAGADGSIIPEYPPLPRAVSSFGADVADDWLYVYGGHCARTHEYSTEAVVGTFHRFRLSSPRAWEELPSGPGLQGLALVAHAGKLYRIGGMQPRNKPGEKADNHSVTSCARFDPAAKAWEPLPDLPEGRSSHDAVVVGDKLIVVGGWNLNGAGKKTDWHTTALVLDLKRQPLQWAVVKQPFQRRALTAAAHDGKVYIIGGMAAESGIELTVNIYDPATGVWSTGPAIPGSRRNGFAPASCVAAGRLYVSAADGKLVRLGGNGDAWEEAGQLKQPRIVHRMVAAGNDLLIALGGASQGDNVALTEALKVQSPRP